MSTSKEYDILMALDKDYFPTPWTQKQWSAHLSLPGGHITLKKNEEDLIGFSCWEELPLENITHLYKILIHPNHRGSNNGLVLLDDTLRQMRNCSSLPKACFLEVAADNTPALSIYRKLGFETLGLAKNFYGPGNNALRMMLEF